MQQLALFTTKLLNRCHQLNQLSQDRVLHQALDNFLFSSHARLALATFVKSNSLLTSAYLIDDKGLVVEYINGQASHLESGNLMPQLMAWGKTREAAIDGMGRALDMILTGRPVEAAEALQMGLANRVVPTGQAREAAIALAQQLAAFPQATMRADRESAYAQGDLALGDALQQEWQRGKARIPDALEGATRFAQGQGRHGRF